jgi:hypothetical protein
MNKYTIQLLTTTSIKKTREKDSKDPTNQKPKSEISESIDDSTVNQNYQLMK